MKRSLARRVATFGPFAALAWLGGVDRGRAQAVLVPPGYETIEANSGTGHPLTGQTGRHQLVIDRSLLAGLPSGWNIRELWIRRDMSWTETMLGGAVDLEIRAGATAASAQGPSEVFRDNRGVYPQVTVFQGLLTAPDAPPASVTPAPWVPPYAVAIPLSPPIQDQGRNLLLELRVRPPAAVPEARWWVADAVRFPPDGSTVNFGHTCSTWSEPALARVGGSLRPGNSTLFSLGGGPPATLAVHVLGFSDSLLFGQPILPLGMTIFGAPGCWLYVDMFQITARVTRMPPQASYGIATTDLRWPLDAQFLSAVGYSQWLVMEPGNVLGLVATNAVRFQLAPTLSPNGVAIVFAADENAPAGRVQTHVFPVLRLVGGP